MSRPRKNPLSVVKLCFTCGNQFTVPYKKNKQLYCSRKCSNNNSEVISKMKMSQKETYLKNYGVEHPMMVESIKQKFQQSMQLKYNVNYYPQTKEHSIKSKITKKKRFGDENFNNIEKRKHTCLSKYGVDNYRKTKEYREKYKETCLNKYGVDHCSKSGKYILSHKVTMFQKFLKSDRFKNFIPQFNINEYNGTTHGVITYPFKCIRCNSIDNHDISNGKDIFCRKCDKTNISAFQMEVFNYIKSILPPEEIVEQNNRKTINPQELDIIIPSRNIAIECNGLCWHSEILGNKNKVYHLNKTRYCINRGIFLVHIFENEWNNKKEIIKSILSNIFGKCKTRIYGRNCIIREINKKQCKEFLEENHLQGNDHSSYKYGLFYNEELVSVMTFCKSRFDLKLQYEMSRFCNKINTTVIGGASRLFKHFINNVNPDSVVSYSDRRYFDGILYKNLNFTFVHNTPPNYYYILNNYKIIQHRMNWQKHKISKRLPIFDSNLSEWENMKNNGFDRIWDCGHSKWIFTTTPI